MIAARAAAPPRRHVLFMANPLIRLLVAQGCAGVQNGDENMRPRVRGWGTTRLILLYFRPQAPVSRRAQHGKYISTGYAASALNAALGLRATRVRASVRLGREVPGPA